MAPSSELINKLLSTSGSVSSIIYRKGKGENIVMKRKEPNGKISKLLGTSCSQLNRSISKYFNAMSKLSIANLFIQKTK